MRANGLQEWFARSSPFAGDALLAAFLTALELLNLGLLTQDWPQGVLRGSDAAVAAYVVLLGVPLVWRRHDPWAVLLALGVGTPIGMQLGIPLASLGLLAALYEVAARAEPRRSFPAGVAVMVVDLGAWVAEFRPTPTVPFTAGGAAVFLVAWGAGFLRRRVRLEQQRRDRDREEEARRVVARERRQVARELHDILAHSMSVIAVQAAGGRRVATRDPQRAAQALAQIEATSRESMAEVRRLLTVLRSDDDAPAAGDPPPGLAQLDALVAQMEAAGVPLVVQVAGERRPLDASVDHSAFRILQESLTNVLRHATGMPARVLLDYGPERLRLEVVNAVPPGAGQAPGPAGRGLLGMRERAALVGGLLEAGPTAEGGFQVAAVLPLASVPSSSEGGGDEWLGAGAGSPSGLR